MATTARPVRIQRRRTKGWTMPANTVYVGRPTRWGNPYILGRVGSVRRWTGWYVGATLDSAANYGQFATRAQAATHAVALYRELSWSWSPDTVEHVRRALAGKDLACWCPVYQACHADILLAIAAGEDITAGATR